MECLKTANSFINVQNSKKFINYVSKSSCAIQIWHELCTAGSYDPDSSNKRIIKFDSVPIFVPQFPHSRSEQPSNWIFKHKQSLQQSSALCDHNLDFLVQWNY